MTLGFKRHSVIIGCGFRKSRRLVAFVLVTVLLLLCSTAPTLIPAVRAWTPPGQVNRWKRFHRTLSRRSGAQMSPTRTLTCTSLAAAGRSSTTSSENPSTRVVVRPTPLLPLPEPIRSNIPGTWAYDTMSRRVDSEILQRTWLDNESVWTGDDQWTQPLAQFRALRNELQNAATTPLTYLDDHEADPVSEEGDDFNAQWVEERKLERQEWKDILRPYVEAKDTWLSAPWMVTEFYVYRRLMAAIGYFDPTSPGYQYDPFDKQKRAGLVSSIGSAEPMLERIMTLRSDDDQGLALAASVALWGNKMDLSLWPANVESSSTDVFTTILHQAAENLLHDDTPQLVEHCEKLRQQGGGNVDIVVDNAGFELVTDLAFATFLIESGIAHTVTFQLKSHPTFVSDALTKDLLETVSYYRELDPVQYPNARRAGDLWQQYLDRGSWRCVEHRFWVQPYAMWDMTEPLRADLSQQCDLAVIKGDANYRRLLGDLKWDYSADFQKVVGCYFPCPVVALRTLKAELGCGMDDEQVKRARQLDDNWLVNGRFGVVQFGEGAGAK